MVVAKKGTLTHLSGFHLTVLCLISLVCVLGRVGVGVWVFVCLC